MYSDVTLPYLTLRAFTNVFLPVGSAQMPTRGIYSDETLPYLPFPAFTNVSLPVGYAQLPPRGIFNDVKYNMTLPVGDVVLKTPRLLTQQPKVLSENLKGLASELGISREAAAVLCTQEPSLLILSSSVLKQRISVSGLSCHVGHCT